MIRVVNIRDLEGYPNVRLKAHEAYIGRYNVSSTSKQVN